MLIVFNQMVSLFLLMLTGYLANRSGVIDKTFESKVSRFIVNISLPATILNAVTGSDMAHDQEMLPIFVAAVSIFLVAHVICHFIQKTIRWNPTYELMLNYSNLGFMGIPIISTIYGGEYVLHVSIFMMTFNLSLFSYGVYLLSKDDAKKTAAAAVSVTFIKSSCRLLIVVLVKDLSHLLCNLSHVWLIVDSATTDDHICRALYSGLKG